MVVPVSGMERPIIEEHIAAASVGLEELASPLGERGIEVSTRVLTGRPVEALLGAAREFGSDSIVLGSYGKDPMKEMLRGSMSAELTRQSTLPILSVRFGALWGKSDDECREYGSRLFNHPLHPTDGSDYSQQALDDLLSLITGDQTLRGVFERMELVHVVDDVFQAGDVHDRDVDIMHEYLKEAVAPLIDAGLDADGHLVEGDPVADILRLGCELDASCIVLGSRGKSLMREAFVGSVSQGILRMSSLPVVVMR